jgi:tetratricopeptide (TPR) repeat protein
MGSSSGLRPRAPMAGNMSVFSFVVPHLAMSHRWDWAGAEAELKRALQLDPQYANAHHWYGNYLSMQRRHDEALAEAQHALELDPLNLMISTWVGLRYYTGRDHSRAIEQNRNSVELDPNFAAAHLLLGEDYVQADMHSEGVSELKRAASLSGSPLYTAQVAVALAAAGRNGEALRIAHELEAVSRKRYVSPYGLAQIYTVMNKNEDAFKWRQAAYDDHAVSMGYLAVDPVFERYRSEDRFKELLGAYTCPDGKKFRRSRSPLSLRTEAPRQSGQLVGEQPHTSRS